MVRLLVGSASVAVIAAAATYFHDRSEARQMAESARKGATFAAELAVARQREEDRWLQSAIANRIAILGMTRSEVRLAKGEPYFIQKGAFQDKAMLDKGAVETWGFRGEKGACAVLFGLHGRVIYSSDSAGKPYEGYAIRQ